MLILIIGVAFCLLGYALFLRHENRKLKKEISDLWDLNNVFYRHLYGDETIPPETMHQLRAGLTLHKRI